MQTLLPQSDHPDQQLQPSSTLPVLPGKESAINKYDWPTILERLFRLQKGPKHTLQDMCYFTGRGEEILPTNECKPFQTRIVISHCAQYPWHPVVRFFPTAPTNLQGKLLRTPRLSILWSVTSEAHEST
jgi:hypothetical protein